MRYLLDTNTVSDLVRKPQGKVAEQILKVGESKVCTSIVVAAELRYGAEKKQSPSLSAQLEAVLGALEILPFEKPADVSYGSIRAQLEPGKRGGKPCIRGLRITVYDVLEYLASGMSHADILREFPYLTEEDIRACLAYAADRERKADISNA